MASRHAHAPWRKAVLIPFWTIQMFFMLVFIGLLAVAAGVLVSWEKNDDEYEEELNGVSDDAINKASRIVIPVWITLCAVCLVLTITEIILLARHKLKPLTFVIMNVIKSGIWTVLFILDVISVVNTSARTTSIVGILIDVVLFLSFWIPLIYGSVIYHRSRKESRTYKPVEHPLSMPQDNIVPTEYPSQYKHFVAEEQHDDVESRPGRPRRLSYNHQRDTRFESYRQERSSFSDPNTTERPMGSPPVPEVYVQHHDGEAYEMGNSRRDLT